MPSKFAYAKSFHRLVCDEISKAIEDLRGQDKEVYPPHQITYIIGEDEITLIYKNHKRS